MNWMERWTRGRIIAGKLTRRVIAGGLIVLSLALVVGIARGQISGGYDLKFELGDRSNTVHEGEFHLARMIYDTFGGAGSHGYVNPWWAIDYPYAEMHFLPALRRLTGLSVSDDSENLELSDDRLFAHPFLFLQQPGQGRWDPTPRDAERLRDYFKRGGFMLVDDFHGEYEWAIFEEAIHRVLPGLPIVEIPEDDPVLHVFYDLHDRLQLPGLRHLRRGRGGQIVARMEGDPHWRGIYDESGRLIVAMNFNMDMGDSWEHADDPYYPAPMTGQAYRLGINYVLYALTH